MRTTWAVLIIGATITAGCGGDDSGGAADTSPPTTPVETGAAAETTEPVATTTTTTTTTAAPATTTAASTTTTTDNRVPTGVGLVWESARDPERVNATDERPTTDVDGVSSLMDMVLVLATDADDHCRDQAVLYRDIHGGDLATQCLVVQWRFDVAGDFRTDGSSPDGGLSSRSVVTAEGRQVDSGFGSSGLPGTVANMAVDTFPHGGEGSTVYWSTGSNLVGWTQHSYTVPADLPPIYFD